MDNITEKLVTPLATDKEYDIVIVGGGPGGVVAALAAARHGSKVLIIEKAEMLGGLATLGMVCLFEPICDGRGRKITKGIVEEMLHLSIKYSYSNLPYTWNQGVDYVKEPENTPGLKSYPYFNIKGRYATIFNMPAFTLTMEELVLSEGIDVIYDTRFCDVVMDGNVCKGVIVENLTGRSFYRGKIIIDGSGYGVVFSRAGVKMEKGENFLTTCFVETDFKSMEEAIKTEDMTCGLRWGGVGYNLLQEGSNISPKKYYGTTTEEINEYVIDSHKAALAHIKTQGKDYAMVSLAGIANLRKCNRIFGRESVLEENAFAFNESSIGCVSDWRGIGSTYEVPYGCLLDTKIKNILAVGRIVSAVGDTWDVLRCYPGAMLTGQAAGTAAALAVRDGISPDDISIPALQKMLEADNVMLHL